MTVDTGRLEEVIVARVEQLTAEAVGEFEGAPSSGWTVMVDTCPKFCCVLYPVTVHVIVTVRVLNLELENLSTFEHRYLPPPPVFSDS